MTNVMFSKQKDVLHGKIDEIHYMQNKKRRFIAAPIINQLKTNQSKTIRSRPRSVDLFFCTIHHGIGITFVHFGKLLCYLGAGFLF